MYVTGRCHLNVVVTHFPKEYPPSSRYRTARCLSKKRNTGHPVSLSAKVLGEELHHDIPSLPRFGEIRFHREEGMRQAIPHMQLRLYPSLDQLRVRVHRCTSCAVAG